MKYKTTKAFLADVQAGKFNGDVVVDNDCVSAYESDECVCQFGGDGAEVVLIDLFEALGVAAERP